MPADDPSRILETLCAYWQTATLNAALDLDLFTALGGEAATAAALARACGADEARLRRLCDALVSLGLLTLVRGRYRSAPEAARFLDARSPETLVEIRRFFNRPPVASGFARLAGRVRDARSRRRPSPATHWRVFAEAATPLRRALAVTIARELQSRGFVRGRILDVGAGASPLGIELLRRNRSASLVVQDGRAVVTLALRAAAGRAVDDRVTALAGDARRLRWGGPYDLVLLINALDYFDDADRALLLGKARAALRPGGAVALYAPLLNRGRASPPDAVAYDLLLLALNAPGGASTFDGLRAELRRAGLVSVTRCHGLPLVLARRRRS